jgi:hypothetical protein
MIKNHDKREEEAEAAKVAASKLTEALPLSRAQQRLALRVNVLAASSKHETEYLLERN